MNRKLWLYMGGPIAVGLMLFNIWNTSYVTNNPIYIGGKQWLHNMNQPIHFEEKRDGNISTICSVRGTKIIDCIYVLHAEE